MFVPFLEVLVVFTWSYTVDFFLEKIIRHFPNVVISRDVPMHILSQKKCQKKLWANFAGLKVVRVISSELLVVANLDAGFLEVKNHIGDQLAKVFFILDLPKTLD